MRDEILLLPSHSCTPSYTLKAIMNTFAGVRLGLWCWFYFCALLAWVRCLSSLRSSLPALAHTGPACCAIRSSRPPLSDVPRTTLACTPLRPSSSSSQACSETRSSLSGKLCPFPRLRTDPDLVTRLRTHPSSTQQRLPLVCSRQGVALRLAHHRVHRHLRSLGPLPRCVRRLSPRGFPDTNQPLTKVS